MNNLAIRIYTGIKQIIVEWKYEPEDYFEDTFTIEYDNYCIEIIPGVATTRIHPKFTDRIDEIINELSQDLESRQVAVLRDDIMRCVPRAKTDSCPCGVYHSKPSGQERFG